MRDFLYKDVIVRSKLESWTMLFLAVVFFPFNNKFLTNYWTTWFGKVYAPTSANLDDLHNHDRVISHEKIHISDAKKWKLWFSVSYLLLPVPIFFCYGRWYWERKAYLPELMELRDSHKFPKRLNIIVNSLGGSSYLWSWPKKWIREWFLKKIYGKNGNIPHERTRRGLLIETTHSESGGVRMGRGHNTLGQAGMRQFYP